MGTLFKQPPRDDHHVFPEAWLDRVLALSMKHSMSVENVISTLHVAEMSRRNDLLHANGDAWDEQVAGIGELLVDLLHGVGELNTTLAKWPGMD